MGYVPEKYLQFPTSNSLLSMLQSLATLDARSHTSSNSTEPELHANCVNGDANSESPVAMYYWMEAPPPAAEGLMALILSSQPCTSEHFTTTRAKRTRSSPSPRGP